MSENKIPTWVAFIAGAVGTYFITDYLAEREKAKKQRNLVEFEREYRMKGLLPPASTPKPNPRSRVPSMTREQELEYEWEILGGSRDEL